MLNARAILPCGDEVSPERAAVLIVDDDPRSRDLLSAYLLSWYDVFLAHDGFSALEMLSHRSFDLVVLDVMMPGMNGFDTCREIKARSREELLPVLMLTALNDQQDRNHGLSAGADEFLSKPVDRAEFLLRVRSLVKIRQQHRQIQQQLEELRRLQLLKDELVSLLVHDVRNPLAGMVACLQLMKRRASCQEDQILGEAFHHCTRAATRLQALLDDILTVRKLEASSLPLDRQMVDVATLLSAAVSTLNGIAQQQNVVFDTRVDDGLVAWLDPKLVQRAIENVVANALSYSSPGDVIRIAFRAVPGGMEVLVGDHGPGVPDELKACIFDKFASIDARRSTSRRGYGLGLYLVQLVISAHGGSASVDDDPNGGAIFRLFFPGEDAWP